MSQPYVGEIRLLPYQRGAPQGWQLCDGSLLPISEYDTLYTLLGTTYGGDGVQTFAVPDMRGRIPIHQGTGRGLSSYILGQIGGSEAVTLTTAQMPAHGHLPTASTAAGTAISPVNNVTATIAGEPFYATAGDGNTPYALPTATVQSSGGGQPHENIGPTLTLNYCIAWAGVYPSQN